MFSKNNYVILHIILALVLLQISVTKVVKSDTYPCGPTDYCRPIIGGLRITIMYQYLNGSFGLSLCTTGLVAYTYDARYGYIEGFITAAHCFQDEDRNYSTIAVVYQPDPLYSEIAGIQLENYTNYDLDAAFVATHISSIVDVDVSPEIRWYTYHYVKPINRVVTLDEINQWLEDGKDIYIYSLGSVSSWSLSRLVYVVSM